MSITNADHILYTLRLMQVEKVNAELQCLLCTYPTGTDLPEPELKMESRKFINWLRENI